MNVLFDKGTPHPPRRSLRPHAVTLIEQMGWPETIKNGDLLRAAEQAGFAAIVTTDTLNGASSLELTSIPPRNCGITPRTLANNSPTCNRNKKYPQSDSS